MKPALEYRASKYATNNRHIARMRDTLIAKGKLTVTTAEAELARHRALHAARMRRYRAKLKAKKANG